MKLCFSPVIRTSLPVCLFNLPPSIKTPLTKSPEAPTSANVPAEPLLEASTLQVYCWTQRKPEFDPVTLKKNVFPSVSVTGGRMTTCPLPATTPLDAVALLVLAGSFDMSQMPAAPFNAAALVRQ